MGKQPQLLGQALHQLVHDLGIDKPLSEFEVITSWSAIVGEQISRVSTAQRIENGVLFVAVSTAPWRAELSLRRREIAEKINHYTGRKVVSDIRFR